MFSSLVPWVPQKSSLILYRKPFRAIDLFRPSYKLLFNSSYSTLDSSIYLLVSDLSSFPLPEVQKGKRFPMSNLGTYKDYRLTAFPMKKFGSFRDRIWVVLATNLRGSYYPYIVAYDPQNNCKGYLQITYIYHVKSGNYALHLFYLGSANSLKKS